MSAYTVDSHESRLSPMSLIIWHFISHLNPLSIKKQAHDIWTWKSRF